MFYCLLRLVIAGYIIYALKVNCSNYGNVKKFELNRNSIFKKDQFPSKPGSPKCRHTGITRKLRKIKLYL